MSRSPSLRGIGFALAALALATMLLVACGGHADGAESTRSAVAAATVVKGDWQRFGYDAQRSGVGPLSTGIDAGTVESLQTRVVHVDGTVDSSAIELSDVVVAGRSRDVIFVTTTYGKTIAIDPATGAKLWEYVPGDIGSYLGSYRIMTATPIADPNRRYIYAATPNGRIHKLAVSNGAEVHSGHWPVRVTFDAAHEKIASALNISGRSLIVVTGGYVGDAPPYQGHVVMIDLGSGHISHVWNALCANRHHLIDPPRSCPASDAAIWARAGAVVEPRTRRLLIATGNAPFNGSTNWGDSVLELSPGAGRLLHNWTPRNQGQLNANDNDLGSTAPAVLPAVGGHRLAVQGGKDGQLHLLNLNRLNGTRGGPGRRLGGEVEDVNAPGGGQVFTAPAVWSHAGRVYVFVADGSGTAAYVLSVGRRARLVTAWQSGSSGTSPVLAGGLLYVYDAQGGALKIYNPVNGARLRSLGAAGGHWNSPIAVGGRIILPTGNANDHSARGTIFIYHLPGE